MIYADEILGSKAAGSDTGFSDKTNATITGGIIGLTGGALYAYFKQKKYLPCTIIGTLAGAIITQLLLIKKNK